MLEPEETLIRFFMKHWTSSISSIPNPLVVVKYMTEYLYKKENVDAELLEDLTDFLEDTVLTDLVKRQGRPGQGLLARAITIH